MADKLSNLQIIQGNKNLTIQYSWFHYYFVKFLVAAIIWDCILGFMFTIILVNSKNQTFHPILFLLGAIGIAFTYVALAHVLNKTDIVVSSDEISTKISPFPWFGNKVIEVDKIVQVKSGQGPGRLMPHFSANVIFMDRSGNKQMIIENLNRADQAEFIVSAINSYLNKT